MTSPNPLQAHYFDGQSAKAHPVTLHLDAQHLHIVGEGIRTSVARADVQWPERTRFGIRAAHLRQGGKVQCADAAAWDQWLSSHGQRDSMLVRLQQSWRAVAASVLVLVALCTAMYLWGLPLAARVVVALIPHSVDAAIGEVALQSIDEHLMAPSQLPLAEQNRLRTAFTQSMATMPAGSLPEWRLVFRKSKIGPNALALPGGTMILTDELVQLVEGDAQVITGVLAHELGHVQHRHGMRMVVQASVIGAVASMVLGDFSTMLAAVPVLMGQAHYSRAAEQEADEHAVQVLKAAGISPLVMVKLFTQLHALRAPPEETSPPANQDDTAPSEGVLGTAFASHPSDAKRIAYFTSQAR